MKKLLFVLLSFLFFFANPITTTSSNAQIRFFAKIGARSGGVGLKYPARAKSIRSTYSTTYKITSKPSSLYPKGRVSYTSVPKWNTPRFGTTFKMNKPSYRTGYKTLKTVKQHKAVSKAITQPKRTVRVVPKTIPKSGKAPTTKPATQVKLKKETVTNSAQKVEENRALLSQRKTKSRVKNKLQPLPEAKGGHTVYRKGPDGKIYKYQTYEKTETGHYNPVKRYDGGKPDGSPGAPHRNSVTKEKIPTPHVQGKNVKGGVRKPESNEIPGGKNGNN